MKENIKNLFPCKKSSAELKLDKPIIIVRVSEESSKSTSMSLADVYSNLLKSDYSGCLALAYGTIKEQNSVDEGFKNISGLIKKIFINENQLSQQWI